MEYTEQYEDMEQRNSLCAIAASNGFRTIHDTFDADWLKGNEPHGTLIFTDEPAPVEPEPEPVRDLAAEIDELRAKIEMLEIKDVKSL